jgi:hypothetical protein
MKHKYNIVALWWNFLVPKTVFATLAAPKYRGSETPSERIKNIRLREQGTEPVYFPPKVIFIIRLE